MQVERQDLPRQNTTPLGPCWSPLDHSSSQNPIHVLPMCLPIYLPPPLWNGLWSSMRMPLWDFRLWKHRASENGSSGGTRHGQMQLSMIAVATSRQGRQNGIQHVESVVQNQEQAFNYEQITPTNVITWISWTLGCHMLFMDSDLINYLLLLTFLMIWQTKKNSQNKQIWDLRFFKIYLVLHLGWQTSKHPVEINRVSWNLVPFLRLIHTRC